MRDRRRAQLAETVKKRLGLWSDRNTKKYEASRRVGLAYSQMEINEIKQFKMYIPFEERIKSNPNLKLVLSKK